MNLELEKIQAFMAAEGVVKFAYLFGSVARGTAGPLSDIDVAVYLDARVNLFSRRLVLMERLAKVLGTDNFDLVVLNTAPVVLKFEVIRNGKVLKEDRQRRVLFESAVLREYLDSAHMRATQYQYLKEKLRSGVLAAKAESVQSSELESVQSSEA